MDSKDLKPTNPKDLVGIKKVPILSVLSPTSIIFEAWAMRDGARKYGPFNYREKGVRAGVYIDAALRHLFAWWDGEDFAPDSRVHHLAHAKACLGIILEGINHGNLVDDRPMESNSPSFMDALRQLFEAQENEHDEAKVGVGLAQGEEPGRAGCPHCAGDQGGEVRTGSTESLPEGGGIQDVDWDRDRFGGSRAGIPHDFGPTFTRR